MKKVGGKLGKRVGALKRGAGTPLRQYIGRTTDLLKMFKSTLSACISCIGPSIVFSMSPLCITVHSCTKGVLIITQVDFSNLLPFFIKSMYSL